MPSELQNLDTIFNSKMFRVPDYQRGYSWGNVQLVDFWDDLDRLDTGRSHYTGQLTLEKAPDAEWMSWGDETWLIQGRGYKPFYIVDGQQRLTTAIILIKCILDRVPSDGQLAFNDKSDHIKKYLLQKSGISEAFMFGYQRDNPSFEYLKSQILAVPQISYEGIETTYTSNLLNARDFFAEKLRKVDAIELERLFKSLTQRFVFSVYELIDDLDVFVVFETMNNRGKKLSTLELLKNRLIYLSTMLPKSTIENERLTLRKNINDAWKTVYQYLGREKGLALDDDDFLWAHWAMYFDYTRGEANALERFLLKEYFTPDKVVKGEISALMIRDYVASIQISVKKWFEIHFPSRTNLLSDSLRSELERLDRLGRGAFEPLLMAALQVTDDDKELNRLFSAAERFVFVVSRLCRIRADAGDSEFYRLAHELLLKQKTFAHTITIIDDRTSRHFSKEKAYIEMRELSRNSEGFYSWSAIRYFLFEYEQHLRSQAGKQEGKIDWNAFRTTIRDHVTVEHIFPQTPKDSDWPTFNGFKKECSLALMNSLGNLLALSQSRNSSFSNRAFSSKRIDFNCVKGYFNGSYSEIAVAQLSDWTPRSIFERGQAMLKFLESRWRIDLGTDQEKIHFLYLDAIDFT